MIPPRVAHNISKTGCEHTIVLLGQAMRDSCDVATSDNLTTPYFPDDAEVIP